MIVELSPSVGSAVARETFCFLEFATLLWLCNAEGPFWHPFVRRASQGAFCSDLTIDLYSNIIVQVATYKLSMLSDYLKFSIHENQPQNIS